MRKIIALLLISFTYAFSSDDTEIIKKQIKWTYPNLTIKHIGKSPIPGIYEIWTGDKILYTDGRYIIIGNIVSPQGDLTSAKEQFYRDKFSVVPELDKIDLSKALKIGDGKRVVIEISDPECPFCRRAEKFFEGKDVSRYIFFMPLPFHKNAKPLAIHILCSDNPQEEYYKAMEGKLDSKELRYCKEGEEKLKQMEKIASSLKVRGTPMFFVKTKDGWKKIEGANPKIANYLEENKNASGR